MYKQHNPPHPGEFIRETYLTPYNGKLSATTVAKHLNVSRSTFNRLINEKSSVTPEMAIKLQNVLGGSAESWLAMQSAYDLWHLEKSIDLTQVKKIDQSVFERARSG